MSTQNVTAPPVGSSAVVSGRTMQGHTHYTPTLRWRIKCAWWRICNITDTFLWFKCGPYRRWQINRTMRTSQKLREQWQRESANEKGQP